MKLTYLKFLLVLSVAISFFNTSANASSIASASVKNVGFQLIDLNPNDGIAPAITFSDPVSATLFRISAANETDYFVTENYIRQLSTRAINQVFESDSFDVHNKMKFDGQLFGNISINSAFYSAGDYRTVLSIDRNFSISPQTEVVFFGDIQSWTYSSESHAQQIRASSAAYVLISTPNLAPGGAFVTGSNTYGGSYGESKHFLFQAKNTYSFETNGTINIVASTYGENWATPVPEPDTYLMLLLGVVFIGAINRKRQV